MTPTDRRFHSLACSTRGHVWLTALLIVGCGGSTVQQPAPELDPASEPAPEQPVAPAPDAEVAPPAEPLPPDVASLTDDASLAQHTRRAWVERPGAIRFTREGVVRPAEERDAWTAFWPNTVVDVADADVRLVHEREGLRVLLWTRAEDLTRVPVEVVTVRPTRTAAAPADDAAGMRLYPGFRLPGAVVRGDVTEFAYATPPVAFRGFVPNASLGPVFVTAAPPERAGEWSMLHSTAALRDRPNGRVIAQFSASSEHPYFEHVVSLIGEERSGHRLVAFRGAASGDEHFEAIGWARTRDLMIEPAGATGRGFGVGTGTGSQRRLRVAVPAGAAIYDAAGGTVIGVAYQDTVLAADPHADGGFELDLHSPWGLLALYTARGTVVPSAADAGTTSE